MNKRMRCIEIWMAVLCLGMVYLGGCSELKTDKWRWFDPSKVIARPARSPILPILPSVSFADETEEVLPNAEPPTEEDYIYADTDYILGPTDVVQVTILDLYFEGQETRLPREISESGLIDMPLLEERIRAEGLTKEQLKEAIIEAYQVSDILVAPKVAVSILAKRNNTFSIFSAAGRTGTYNLARKDMRLLEALALAGGVAQPGTEYIYVIRPKPAIRRSAEEGVPGLRPLPPEKLPELPKEVPPEGPAGTRPAEDQKTAEQMQRELDLLLPGGPRPQQPETLPAPSVQIALSETATGPFATNPTLPPPPKSEKWVYTAEGRWIRVQQEAPVATHPSGQGVPPVQPVPTVPTVPRERPAGQQPPALPPTTATAPRTAEDPYGWKDVEKAGLARIIAINYKQLVKGDPRMNIVIRNRDIIRIPEREVGEFYLAGEIARPGVYSLTGRRITVKQAVAAGGNLGVLAWPENSYLVRRIGRHQEQYIPLDLEAIFKGEAPDIFLKPDDVIAVGTDWKSPFYAVFRNAFRFSYGFGFLYDRNFSEAAPPGLTSRRFEVW
ncbi:MAG TPA: polysaccharide biosynthesis/export family protein [Phycisphaerae bacterium]|nr:polysaccharide biosynthesis/export family protein [Phycisphaerae bacterium]